MSWKNVKQIQNGSEDIMVGKHKFFIDLNKTKVNQNHLSSKKFSNGTSKRGSDHVSLVDEKNSDDSFPSDENFISSYNGLDLTLKNLTTTLSDYDFKKLQGKDALLSQTINPNNSEILTPFQTCFNSKDIKPENSADEVEEIKSELSATPHYVKYINRDGKVIKVWECGICGRNFQHQYTLMRHLPTHTNVRNFICNECGKAFRQLSTLSQHRAIHSIDRPYTCEICNKSFNRISTLISHRKTHSNVKPFQCHMCHKAFHQKGNLRNHIYIHTNERPYRCSYCNKGFNQMSNLVCHTQKTHSSELQSMWTCHRCEMSFSKRTLLRAHELETHKIHGSTSRITRSKGSFPRKNSTATSNPPKITENFSKSEISKDGILIPAIETDAMKTAKANKEMPFAVIHFFEGLPLLVRIIDAGKQSLLRPANTEDFVVLQLQQQSQTEKVSVPIVAAVYQTLNASGRPEFTVMPPKNIYKFINPQQIMTQIGDGEKKTKTDDKPLESNFSLAPPQIPSDLSDVTGNFEMPLFETLAAVKDEEYIGFNDINALSGSSSTLSSFEEKPRAIAIVEEPKAQPDTYYSLDGFSETFQNIATGKLLTPKKVSESEFLPENDTTSQPLGSTSSISNAMQNQFEINPNLDTDCLSSFLGAIRNEGAVRSLFSENRSILNDFNEFLTDIFQ